MDQLIEFFSGLGGKHIPKDDEESKHSCAVESSVFPATEGIDCCDVIDTCCDSYD